jgi:hypothetical protein
MAYKTYKGKYKVKDPSRYIGDSTKVVYRSLWERKVFQWCENNPDVSGWNSEEIVVPYRCNTDRKMHNYYVDVLIVMKTGKTFLVEIKPRKQTEAPKKPSRTSKKYINEVTTYIKNTSKWEAAQQYAIHKGWHFQIWTEDTLKNLGIKLITN